MTRKTRPYREVLLERLGNPVVAAHYLNATLDNTPDTFLAALKNVAKARQMAKVAKDSGIQRETLYRSLSDSGNPTWDTLTSLFGALGLRFQVLPEGGEIAPAIPPPAPIVHSSPELPSTPIEISNPLDNSEQVTGGIENAFWQAKKSNSNFSQGALA